MKFIPFLFLFLISFSCTTNAQFIEQLRTRTIGIPITDPSSPKKKVKILSGGNAGQILTKGAGNLILWADPTNVNDNDWNVSGNNMWSIPSGNIGIGITNPEQKLHVVGNSILGDITIGNVTNKNRLQYFGGKFWFLDDGNGYENVSGADAVGPNDFVTKQQLDALPIGGDNLGNHIATNDISIGNWKLKSTNSIQLLIDSDNNQTTSAFFFLKNTGDQIASLSEQGAFHLFGNIKIDGVSDPYIQTKYYRFDNAANSTPTNAKSLYYYSGDLTFKDPTRGIRTVALYSDIGTNYTNQMARVSVNGNYSYNLVVGEHGIVENTNSSSITVTFPSGINISDKGVVSTTYVLNGREVIDFIKISSNMYILVSKY